MAAVYVGSSQQPAWSQMLSTSNGQLAAVDVPLAPGTTQVKLEVTTVSGAAYGDVVWVAPRIENASAPSPSPRPTVTSSLLRTKQYAILQAAFGNVVIAPKVVPCNGREYCVHQGRSEY